MRSLNFSTFITGIVVGIASLTGSAHVRAQSPGTIAAIAGTGATGFSGDGGAATAAQIGSAQDVAVDTSGNVFIADTDNNRVRKIASDGTITTVAGTGTAGFAGDGGPANQAQLNRPVSLAVDGSGNVYIADNLNNRVRKVSANGTITTFAGDGKKDKISNETGPAAQLTLGAPSGLTLDKAGNLYIATNFLIRKVAPDGTVRTVAGQGQTLGGTNYWRKRVGVECEPAGS
jgi:hypothetical protein